MLELGIAAICTHLTLSDVKYNPACNKAVEASVIQLDIKSKAEVVQKIIEKKVITYTGNEVWIAAGMYYHFIQTSELRYSAPAKPISDNISFFTNTKERSWSLGLTWYFP